MYGVNVLYNVLASLVVKQLLLTHEASYVDRHVFALPGKDVVGFSMWCVVESMVLASGWYLKLLESV